MKQNWEYKKLGDVCEIVCGQDYKSVQDDNGPYPIYGTGGIMGYASQYRCPEGSVIVGRKGSINNPLYVETKFWNVDTAFGIVPNGETLQSKFFFYFCRQYDFTKHDVSVTIPSLRRTDIMKIDIPVPPMSEQERIVAELDLLNGVLEKQKAQLKELDTLAQSIFYDMFGDPIENPKGWTVEVLGKLCEITSSKRIFANEYTENGVPFYRSKEIAELGSNKPISTELFISWERYQSIRKAFGVPQVGDILICAIGATIGKLWVVNTNKEFYFKDGNIIWLKNGAYNSIYMRYILFYVVEQLKTLITNGGAYPALTIVTLKTMQILVPPLSLQQAFADKIASIEKQKTAINQSMAETQKLLDYTMDKYFG